MMHKSIMQLETYSFWNLLGKWLEFTIEIGSSSSFFLFLLQLILIAIQVPPSFIASLIELNVWCFTIELDILSIVVSTSNTSLVEDLSYFGFLFANKDGILEMDMNEH